MFSVVSCSGSKHTAALAQLALAERGTVVILVLVHKESSLGLMGNLKPQLISTFSVLRIYTHSSKVNQLDS